MMILAQHSTMNPPAPSSSQLVDELMSGLQPLKPVVDIPVEAEPSSYGLWIWGMVGVMVLTALFFLMWNRRHRKLGITSEQRALASLDELTHEKLENDDFVMRVSHILKAYLEEKKFVTAVRQTTEEFLLSLRSSEELREQRNTLKTFFEQCDLVKFAGGSLADEQRGELIDSVRCLIKGIAEDEPSEM